MSEIRQKLNEISKGKNSKWSNDAEFRSQNKWLRYSSKIARRIMSAIEDKDISQLDLAKSLGVSAQQISKIIKGKQNLTLKTIYNLSQQLGVELIAFPEYKYSVAINQIPTYNTSTVSNKGYSTEELATILNRLKGINTSQVVTTTTSERETSANSNKLIIAAA